MKNNDALQILFIRHAETDYNDLDGRDPSDGNLNANGVQQCIELGEKLYGTEEYDFCCEGIEANDIRAKKVVDYIKSRFTFGERVAVFSHHGFLEHLIPTALGIETHRFDFALDNISITVVDINRNGSITLRCVNKKDL